MKLKVQKKAFNARLPVEIINKMKRLAYAEERTVTDWLRHLVMRLPDPFDEQEEKPDGSV